jgi:hypothetical protein
MLCNGPQHINICLFFVKNRIILGFKFTRCSILGCVSVIMSMFHSKLGSRFRVDVSYHFPLFFFLPLHYSSLHFLPREHLKVTLRSEVVLVAVQSSVLLRLLWRAHLRMLRCMFIFFNAFFVLQRPIYLCSLQTSDCWKEGRWQQCRWLEV